MKDNLTLLTFSLDQVLYAIDIHEVQEVVLLPELTPFADGPSFVSGIFNLRDHIVTAIDLRQRLGLKGRPWDIRNAVLIIASKEKLYGLIVDEALSLIALSNLEIEAAPDLSPFTGSAQGKFVLAVGKLNGRLIPILNLSRILTVVEPTGFSDWQTKEQHD